MATSKFGKDWDDAPTIRTAKSPRKVKGYPRRPKSLVRFHKRGAVKRDLIRQERPRTHARPWRYKTSFDEAQSMEDRAAQNVRGSLQERLFYRALVNYGFIPGVDFDFQSSQLGGRMQLGGLVADFMFEGPRVIVQVQSIWHTITLEHEVRDNDQAMILRSMGYIVLELWPPTIEDPAALDYWIERNISTLWGTSSQPLGLAGFRDLSYLEEVMFEKIERLERDVDFLKMNFATGYGPRLDKIEGSIFSGATGTGLIINSAAVAEILKSTNYQQGVSGWKIEKSGNMELQQAIVRGTIFAAAGSFTGVVDVGSAPNKIIIDGPGKRLYSENYVAGISGWQIKGDGTAEFQSLTTPFADITTLVKVGVLPNVIYIDGVNKTIGSSNYVPDVSGWLVDSAGVGEFRDLKARGAIQSAVFSYQEINVTAGTQVVAKSGGVLAQNFTSAAGAGANRLWIKDPLVGAALLFGVGDILRIKWGAADNWFSVTATGSGGGPAGATYFYDCTLVNGSASTAFTVGASVIDYGASGAGYIRLVGDGTQGPAIRIVTHTGTPWASSTEHVRIGNLKFWGPIGAVDRFGAAFGNYSTGNYIYFDPSVDLMKMATAGGTVEFNATGIQMEAGTASKNQIKWVSGATTVGKMNTYFDTAASLTRTNVKIETDPSLTDLSLLWLKNGNTMNLRLEEDAGGSVFRIFHTVTSSQNNVDVGTSALGSSRFRLFGSTLAATFPSEIVFAISDGVYGEFSIRTNKVSGGTAQRLEATGPIGVGWQMPVAGTYKIVFPGQSNFTALATFSSGLTGASGSQITSFTDPMSAAPLSTLVPTERGVQRFVGQHITGSQGRLTPSSTDATPNTFNSSTNTIYLLPYVGDRVVIWDGSYWIARSMGSTGTSIAVPATTDTSYDVFARWTGSVLALELTAWSNSTTRATGITKVDGIWTRSGAQDRTYLGTIRTSNSSGLVPYTQQERFVWNQYNRISQRVFSTNSNTHTYNSTTRRAYDNVNTLWLEWIEGNLTEDHVRAVSGAIRANVENTSNEVGMALNSPTFSGGILVQNRSASQSVIGATEMQPGALGLNVYYPFESATTSVSTFSFARFHVMVKM